MKELCRGVEFSLQKIQTHCKLVVFVLFFFRKTSFIQQNTFQAVDLPSLRTNFTLASFGNGGQIFTHRSFKELPGTIARNVNSFTKCLQFHLEYKNHVDLQCFQQRFPQGYSQNSIRI